MIIEFNGRSSDRRRDQYQGDKPSQPVKWTGKFLVADAQGNALETEWQRNGSPPMNYEHARESAFNVIDSLTARLFEQNKQPIKKVAFTLSCR